jgi:hypothetical protein
MTNRPPMKKTQRKDAEVQRRTDSSPSTLRPLHPGVFAFISTLHPLHPGALAFTSALRLGVKNPK